MFLAFWKLYFNHLWAESISLCCPRSIPYEFFPHSNISLESWRKSQEQNYFSVIDCLFFILLILCFYFHFWLWVCILSNLWLGPCLLPWVAISSSHAWKWKWTWSRSVDAFWVNRHMDLYYGDQMPSKALVIVMAVVVFLFWQLVIPFHLSETSFELLRPHRAVLIILPLSLKSESVNCSVVSESFQSHGW